MQYAVDEVRERLKIFQYSGFTFDPVPHKYHVDGIELTSVTTFIGQHHEHFDAEAVANRIAAKRNTTPEALINEWAEINAYACTLGHKVHEFIEHYIDGIILNREQFDSNMNGRIDKFIDYYENRLKLKVVPVGQEVRMFSKRMRLAGTFDFLVTIDGKLYILDWKTNRKLETDENIAFKKYMYKPFHNLLDHNFNHYSIQTSIYRLMLKYECGLDVAGCIIIYIPEVGDIQALNCKDYRPELIKHFGL